MIGNLSNKDDAKCHRERKSANKVFAFQEKKLYLGRDTRQKLALIAQQLTGARLNIDKFDAEKAADVISACVNHMFVDLFKDSVLDGFYGLEEHPVIIPARSPKAFDFYTAYQLVKGRFDKLNTGESDRDKYESVAEKLNEYKKWKPQFKHLSGGKEWTREDVAWMLQPENINRVISIQNHKFEQSISKNRSEIATD
ncbi:hypothetical protein VRC35_04890 [Erwinia aphidicola]|uniref:hypothetical protein n=1 Tax=Erwinia aphidicola TaxID=68334 RepID=UPI0030D5CDAF